MLIGLTGVAQSGKDTAAELLIRLHGFERRAFADKLRAMAYAIDPAVIVDGGPMRLATLVDAYGWDYAKARPDVRRFLQRLGTEGVRDHLGVDIWANAPDFNGDRIVVTDVRFPNEAQRIRNAGGIIVRVERPGVGRVNDHASENEITADHVLVNDSDLDALRVQVHNLLSDIIPDRPRQDS